ncbi:MAG: hypothetical protein ABJE95_02800 [Byssovorax sp.]
MLAAIPARRFAATLVALALGASLVAACAPRATRDDCEKLGDHLVEVLNRNQDAAGAALMKPILDKVREKEITACTGKMTVSQVKCGMEARTGAEMDRCVPRD